MTFHISINDDKSEIWREYVGGIRLEQPYEVGLKSFVTYNNIFNVTEKNNKIVYVYPEPPPPEPVDPTKSPEEGEKMAVVATSSTSTDTYEITVEEIAEGNHEKKKRTKMARKHHLIPPGIYEVEDLTQHILSQVPDGRSLTMRLNKNTLTVEFHGNVGLDFSSPTSIGPLLGFERRQYRAHSFYTSTRLVDIFPINMIRVRCNLVKSNIFDTKLHDDTIYDFPLNVEPGEKIIERPNSTIYYKVNTDIVYDLHLKIVDQDNKLVDFRGEKINIVLEFRPTT